MSWRAHMAVGGNMAWVVALATQVHQFDALLVVVGAVAALLPDIDANDKGAKIHYVAGGTLGGFKGMFRHRGFFHSFLATVIVFGIAYIFLRNVHPLMPVVIALGYLSHAIIDAFNMTGVEFLFPWRKRISLLPRVLRTRVGGPVDIFLFVAGSLGIAMFLFLYYYPQLDLNSLVY